MKKVITNIKKNIYRITDIIIIILVIFVSIYIFQTTILKKKYVDIFNYTTFRVATGSMKEEININDIIIVKITNQIEENDVIVFEQNGSLIVHRVIAKNNEYIVTKGDANNYNDEPIKEEQVIGKVVIKISNSLLIKVIIFIVTFNLILYLISKIVSGYQEDNKTIKRKDTKNETK